MPRQIRELIGVAVATQGSYQLCLYFHTAAALANGASEGNIQGALRLAEVSGPPRQIISEVNATPKSFRQVTGHVLWGDASTVTARSPSADFRHRLVAAAGDLRDFCD